MRYLIVFMLFVLYGSPVFAQDVAPVASDLVVTGIVTSDDGKVQSSAIVNDCILWEHDAYIYDSNTKKFNPAYALDGVVSGAAVRVILVEHGKVHFECTDHDGKTTRFYKKLKHRTSYGLSRSMMVE